MHFIKINHQKQFGKIIIRTSKFHSEFNSWLDEMLNRNVKSQNFNLVHRIIKSDAMSCFWILYYNVFLFTFLRWLKVSWWKGTEMNNRKTDFSQSAVLMSRPIPQVLELAWNVVCEFINNILFTYIIYI